MPEPYLLVIADVHANQQAFQSVLRDAFARYSVAGIAMLGDLIDYGMHSNEVVDLLLGAPAERIVELPGNHEIAYLTGNYEGYASEKCRAMMAFTAGRITPGTRAYLVGLGTYPVREAMLAGKRVLFVHGSLEDPSRGVITPDVAPDAYLGYDVVISAHSHCPHFFERYAAADTSLNRNAKGKKVAFLNPGSVGQPRNHNPKAQYLVCSRSFDEFYFHAVGYDIQREQSAYHTIHEFYRDRLASGI